MYYWRDWRLSGRWSDGGRRCTVARWTRWRAAPVYAPQTWPKCIFRQSNVWKHYDGLHTSIPTTLVSCDRIISSNRTADSSNGLLQSPNPCLQQKHCYSHRIRTRDKTLLQLSNPCLQQNIATIIESVLATKHCYTYQIRACNKTLQQLLNPYSQQNITTIIKSVPATKHCNNYRIRIRNKTLLQLSNPCLQQNIATIIESVLATKHYYNYQIRTCNKTLLQIRDGGNRRWRAMRGLDNRRVDTQEVT